MSDTSKVLADASRAKALLEDEMLQRIYEGLKATYYQQWFFTLPEEHAKRERFWQAMHILQIVQDHLRTFVEDGKTEKAHLDQVAYLKSHT